MVEISAGIYHTLAIRADGTVTGWGFSGNHLLEVPSNLSDVLAVAAGGYHSLAVHRDGTVVAWGYDGNGRTDIPDTLTDVVALAAGRDFSVALKSNGTVVSWGLNDEGQTAVPTGLKDVIAVCSGDNHTLALRSDGTVVAWGKNSKGQCNVPAGLDKAVAIAAGAEHSLALRSDGTIVGWGSNTYGQRNFAGNSYRAIAAGGYHSLAVTGTGPMINRQPLGQTVLAGATVSFSVAATGLELGYQWYRNGKELTGENASVLVVSEAGRADTGVYSVRVFNSDGATVSANAALMVRGLQQLAAPEVLADGTVRLVFGDQHGDPISAPNAVRYKAEVSDDLVVWFPLSALPVLQEGRLLVVDPDAAHHLRRFYRVVENEEVPAP